MFSLLQILLTSSEFVKTSGNTPNSSWKYWKDERVFVHFVVTCYLWITYSNYINRCKNNSFYNVLFWICIQLWIIYVICWSLLFIASFNFILLRFRFPTTLLKEKRIYIVILCCFMLLCVTISWRISIVMIEENT